MPEWFIRCPAKMNSGIASNGKFCVETTIFCTEIIAGAGPSR